MAGGLFVEQTDPLHAQQNLGNWAYCSLLKLILIFIRAKCMRFTNIMVEQGNIWLLHYLFILPFDINVTMLWPMSCTNDNEQYGRLKHNITNDKRSSHCVEQPTYNLFGFFFYLTFRPPHKRNTKKFFLRITTLQ